MNKVKKLHTSKTEQQIINTSWGRDLKLSCMVTVTNLSEITNQEYVPWPG